MPVDDEGNRIGYGQLAAGLLAGSIGLTRNAKRTAYKAGLAGGGYVTKRLLASEEKKILKKTLRQGHELKNSDVTNLSVAITTSAQLTYLNAIPEGDTPVNRSGRKVKIEGVWLDLLFENSQAAAADSDIVRCMVVWDNEANLAAPTIGQILQDVTAGVRLNTSLPNADFTSRFKILYDTHILLNDQGARGNSATPPAAATSTPYAQFRHVKKYLRVNRISRYAGTNNGTIVDQVAGSIYLILQSVNGAASCFGMTRVAFRDV